MENEQFIKLNKSQKLKIPISKEDKFYKITIALFIPTKTKNDGYVESAFFIQSKKGLWYRLNDYDCFRFINSHNRLKGDFENGGVQFFMEGNWETDYGGEFIRTN